MIKSSRITDIESPNLSPATVDPYCQLAASVMLKALADLCDPSPVVAWDALYWLDSEAAELFSEVLELGNPLTPVSTGQYKKARRMRKQ